MSTEALTPDRILEATEEVLRRYGPGKATVVDVARALGVSHGSVYRHFRTKAALREAVTERWLERAVTELAPFADGPGPAAERLTGWLRTLFAAKRRKAGADPELFATYEVLIGESSRVVAEHVDHLVGQLARIIEDGHRRGEFAAPPSTGGGFTATARAVFDATDRFHDPVHAADWTDPGIDAAFDAVVSLLLRGLRA
ncbi:TetR/AcrR family transcriptional regulator [Streptomyces sp. NPDC016309]|uniref:TetR/AcrR family transcriptional regulator n=1 Tax=Streptomyces sp. NPDC016309 TaxID=3364965 RepID=UPI0036F51FC9